MMKKNSARRWASFGIAVLVCGSTMALVARTVIRPGFNLFTPKQDVELGREAATQADKQLLILNDPDTTAYVTEIGRKLAAKSMHPDYPWTFKVVNDRAINAFALPGGFIYVNRGALETADNEAQIAGVIGHEIGHVVARHGTNQMSKALFPQLGLAMLGGLTSGKGGWGALLARYGVPLGMNLYFLKNSREHEAQADLLGTQEMTDAGYDPHQLARFFEKLEGATHSNVSGAAAWFADHPSPENRVQSIDHEIAGLTVAHDAVEDTPQFDRVKSHLRSLPPPPKPKTPSGGSKATSGSSNTDGATTNPSTIPAPSGVYAAFSPKGSPYHIEYPKEWKAMSDDTSGATFVPAGGIQQIDQRSDIVFGMQVSLWETEGHGGHQDSLERMTDQFIGSLLQGNNYLQEDRSAQQQWRIHGRPVLLSTLQGRSPYRDETEIVWVATQTYGEHKLFSIICIAPQNRFKEFEPAFRHAIDSVRY